MKTLRILFPLLSWLAVCGLMSMAQSRGYTVQTASRQSEAEARAEMAKLAAAGLPAHLVRAQVRSKGIWYRIRYGRFNTLAEAQLSAEQTHKRGLITDYIVTLYETPLASAATRREPKINSEDVAGKSGASSPTATEKGQPVPPKKVTEKAHIPAGPVAPTPTGAKEPLAKETSKELLSKETLKNPPPKPTGNTTTNKSETNAPPAAKTVVAEMGQRMKTPPASPPISPPLKAAPESGTPASKPSLPEPKPERVADTSNSPGNEAAPGSSGGTGKPVSRAAAPEKVSPVPRLAQPPLPDALGELDIANRNWKIVRRSTMTDKNLRAIYFVDSMTGWAAGDAGAVYRTTDGGKTWKPLLSGAAANINQIFFVDWNQGWMLGELTRKDDAEAETVLLSTTNGGRSWQKKALPNVLSIFFTDAQHGWAVGKNATVLRTVDGGNEWKPAGDLEKLIGHPVESSNYNFGFRDIFFLDAQHGWLIGNFFGRTKNNIGGLFVTSDGGTTWKRVPLTVQTKYSSGRFTPGMLFSVHFTEVNAGTVTGEMYDGEERFFFSLHTRDGGKSWEQYRTPSRALHSTQFLDPALGWTAAAAPREGGADAVVYDTTLLRTDNGGASWRQDFTARGSRIRGVFFLSPTKGWAVGDRGMILRYEEKTKSN